MDKVAIVAAALVLLYALTFLYLARKWSKDD